MKTIVLMVGVMCAAVPVRSFAQAEPPSVPAMMEALEAGAGQGIHLPSSERPIASTIVQIVREPARFPAARVDSVLDGLRQVAVEAEGEAARYEAMSWLHDAGERGSNRHLVGIVRRLADVYRAARSNGDAEIQWNVLWLMSFQSEVGEAHAFLDSLAANGDLNQSWLAVHHLNQMGFREREHPGLSVSLVLRGFQEATETRGYVPYSRAFPLAGEPFAELNIPERASPARIDSIADGLALLAATAPASATRRNAVVELLIAGQASNDAPVAGMVDRLASVYWSGVESGDTGGQRLILQGMPLQAEADAAQVFLERVIVESPRGRAFGMALVALGGMGEAGRRILRRLDEDGAVLDVQNRARLHRWIEESLAPNE